MPLYHYICGECEKDFELRHSYGEKGIAALASMLQSCSLGLSVVNIDNGIAAGGIAANIANRTIRKKE